MSVHIHSGLQQTLPQVLPSFCCINENPVNLQPDALKVLILYVQNILTNSPSVYSLSLTVVRELAGPCCWNKDYE